MSDQVWLARSPEGGSHDTRYRVFILSRNGELLDTAYITANDDEAAIRIARGMVDRHAVELWDGVRFVEHFDVEGGGS